MGRVVLDSTLECQFMNATERLEVCDHSGRILGVFTPVADRALYEKHKSPFTSEELDAFEREPGGRSLSEILADLEKRAADLTSWST